MIETKRRFNKMAWFKQLLPRTLYTIYRDEQKDGQRFFCIWRQWLGKATDVRRIPIGEV